MYSVVAWMLWLVPLFNRLHVESAAVIAATAFFTAGLGTLRRLRHERDRRGTGSKPSLASVPYAQQFAYPLVAAAWLTISALWAPNCDILRGAMLFATFVLPSVAFGMAVAVFVHWRAGGRRWLLVAFGVAVMMAGPIYDYGFHPQFYTYNHVFGGVLGPIYDDELVIRPGIFLFRLFTFAWAGLLVGLAWGRWRLAVASVALLIAGYSQAGPLGINTSQAYLEKQFSARVNGDGYALFHYDTNDNELMSDSLVNGMRDEMDWQMHRLDSLLGVRPEDIVRVFAWPSADERARHTGARYTSVAPVWLDVPQIHVVKDQFSRFASHELVHVFSREFGLPVIRASTMAGLVEGLAVAFESPDGSPSAHHLVAAAHGGDSDLGRRLGRALTPSGFWTGRGAVSYTVSGSFVQWLGMAYGVDRLRRVYPNADFEGVYGKKAVDLAAQWQQYLKRLPVLARTAGREARRSFGRLSLFEKQCPHYVPPRLRALREALQVGGSDALRSVVEAWPEYVPARYALAQALVAEGNLSGDVRAALHLIPPGERYALWYELMARSVLVTEPETAAELLRESLRRTPVDHRSDRSARAQLLGAAGAAILPGLQAERNAFKKWTQSRKFYAVGDIAAARKSAAEAKFLYLKMGDVAMVPVLDEWIQRYNWLGTVDTHSPNRKP